MHGKSNAPIDAPRVLMVSQRFHPYIAGAEQQALGLARALARANADVRVVTTRYDGDLSRTATIEGVDVERIVVPFGTATRGAAFHLAKVGQIAAMARHVASKARGADIVHAHCLSASSLGAVLGAGFAGTPVVVKPSLGGADGELHKLLASPAAGVLKAILGRVDRFAVMSDEIADELSAIGISNDRFALVENGIDLDQFTPATEDERAALRARLGLPDWPVALFVGQYVRRKGVPELLDAWPRVRARFPTAMLAFAGHGPERPSIDAQARDPRSGIVDLGARSDVGDVLRAANLLVFPSRNESFGNVIVEALACGLPVLVGKTGVARRIELDGRAGRFVDPDSPASIAEALSEFLGDPERCAAAAAHARALVRRFDFDRVAASYLEIYRSMRRREPASASEATSASQASYAGSKGSAGPES